MWPLVPNHDRLLRQHAAYMTHTAHTAADSLTVISATTRLVYICSVPLQRL